MAFALEHDPQVRDAATRARAVAESQPALPRELGQSTAVKHDPQKINNNNKNRTTRHTAQLSDHAQAKSPRTAQHIMNNGQWPACDSRMTTAQKLTAIDHRNVSERRSDKKAPSD